MIDRIISYLSVGILAGIALLSEIKYDEFKIFTNLIGIPLIWLTISNLYIKSELFGVISTTFFLNLSLAQYSYLKDGSWGEMKLMILCFISIIISITCIMGCKKVFLKIEKAEKRFTINKVVLKMGLILGVTGTIGGIIMGISF